MRTRTRTQAAALAEHAAAKHPKLPEAQCWPGLGDMRAREAANAAAKK
jgi:hypothetical protein